MAKAAIPARVVLSVSVAARVPSVVPIASRPLISLPGMIWPWLESPMPRSSRTARAAHFDPALAAGGAPTIALHGLMPWLAPKFGSSLRPHGIRLQGTNVACPSPSA